MKVTRKLQLESNNKPVMLAAGFFDGVHRGHHAVLSSAVKSAHNENGEAWVLTFNHHPMEFLHPNKSPQLLTTSTERLHLFDTLGIDGCLLLEFNRGFSAMTPDEFIVALTRGISSLKQIFIGPNWRFGRNAEGTPKLLQEYAARHNFSVKVIPPVEDTNGILSSTRIRNAVRDGRIIEANALLGRNYTLHGRIIKGRQVGRTLGYPTANISTTKKIIPPCGIYAAYTEIKKSVYRSLLYIGHRKTFKGLPPRKHPAIEIHLLNFDGNLYDKTISVQILKHLRNDMTFSSPEALRQQIAGDVDKATQFFVLEMEKKM